MFVLFLMLFILILLITKKSGSRDNKVYIIDRKIKFKPYYSRILLKGPQEAFYGRHVREMIALKLGARKLIMADLEFYVLFLQNLFSFSPQFQNQLIQDFLAEHQKILVIYSGIAPSYHLKYLTRFFSAFKFHYYNNNIIPKELRNIPNLEIFDKVFSESEALKYNRKSLYLHSLFSEESFNYYPPGNPFSTTISTRLKKIKNDIFVLFISDYRTGIDDLAMKKDMDLYMKWINIIQPDAYSLKLRLPWESGSSKFLEGDIYLEPRLGPSSTETRLNYITPKLYDRNDINRIYKKKKYDHDEYNNRIFYFQRHNRLAFHEFFLISKKDIFPKLADKIKGLCHCYYCWSEIEICKNTLSAVDPEFYILLNSRDKNNRELTEKILINKIVNFLEKLSIATFSNLDRSPHNMFVFEQDINKKINLLENISKKYIGELIEEKTNFFNLYN